MIYLQLLWVFVKIGVLGFGGGYAMLSLIQHEVIKSKIEGFHAEAGLFAYYSLFNCNEYWFTNADISLGLNAARTEYEKFGPVYSLNAFLTISLKLNMSYL